MRRASWTAESRDGPRGGSASILHDGKSRTHAKQPSTFALERITHRFNRRSLYRKPQEIPISDIGISSPRLKALHSQRLTPQTSPRAPPRCCATPPTRQDSGYCGGQGAAPAARARPFEARSCLFTVFDRRRDGSLSSFYTARRASHAITAIRACVRAAPRWSPAAAVCPPLPSLSRG
jgi:hypothetical protein